MRTAETESNPSSYEITGIPEQVQLVNTEIVQVGEAVIGSGSWGREVAEDEVLRLAEQVLPPERVARFRDQTLPNIGMPVRHHSVPLRSVTQDTDLISNEMVSAGTQLVNEVVKAVGWNDVDLAIATTSIPPRKDWAERVLKGSGISLPAQPWRKLREYFLSCASQGTALLDVLRSEELQDQRILVFSDEALSHGNLRNFSPETIVTERERRELPETGLWELIEDRLVTVAVFGNGVAAWAFRPRDLGLYWGKTVILPDKAATRTPHLYDPPLEQHVDPIKFGRDYYELRGESERVFAMTREGVYLGLPPAEDPDRIEMEDDSTARHFARLLPSLILELRAELQKAGGEFILAHQASKGMLGIVRGLVNKRLARLGLPLLTEENMPWVLDKRRVANFSSGTTPAALGQVIKMEQRGEIPARVTAGEPFGLLSFGIGSAATGMVISFKPAA